MITNAVEHRQEPSTIACTLAVRRSECIQPMTSSDDRVASLFVVGICLFAVNVSRCARARSVMTVVVVRNHGGQPPRNIRGIDVRVTAFCTRRPRKDGTLGHIGVERRELLEVVDAVCQRSNRKVL